MKTFLLAAATLAATSFAHADGVSDRWDLPAASTTTRAEVRAETMLWKRSGLAQLQQLDSYNPYGAQAQQAQARFARLMNGPDYTAELRRQQGDTRTAVAAGPRSGD